MGSEMCIRDRDNNSLPHSLFSKIFFKPSSAPAAKDGASAVVYLNAPLVWIRYSPISEFEAMKAPPLPNAYPKVPVIIVISERKLKLKPLPSGPKIPIA